MNINTIEKIENWILYIVLFLLPLVSLSIFPNSFLTGKVILLIIGVSILLIIKSIKTVIRGHFEFNFSPYDFPVILFSASALISAILKTPNKMEAFFLPGTATILGLSALLYFFVNQLNEKAKSMAIYSIVASATAGSIITLLNYTQVIKVNTLGGYLPAIIFLVSVAPLTILEAIRRKEIITKSLLATGALIILFGSLVSFISILPGKDTTPQLPSLKTSWIITAESLKESPLMGIGTGNYLTAFNKYKPFEYNQTNLWRIRFSSANNFYLTMITEAGILALAGIILIAYQIVKNLTKTQKENTSAMISLIVCTLTLLVTPGNIIMYALLFTLIGLSSTVHKARFGVAQSEKKEVKLHTLVAAFPVIALVIVGLFYTVRVSAAELTYKKALLEISNNNAKEGYDILRSAIEQNMYVDRYRISYAQLNLALANAVAQKKDITEEERNTIGKLIQQSIREGKAAIALNPQRATNWEVLARIYMAVAPLAENADGFAAETFRQAINLDPLNPELRIAQGGIFYARKDYQSAQRIFERAVATKPDLANSHYNLAFAYKEAGNTQAAIESMKVVLSLVQKDSKDYENAKKTLEELETKKKTEEKAQKSDNLTPPTENEPVLNPPLELPEDAEPPKEEVTGEANTSPTPSQSPSSSPKASPKN